VSDQQYHSGEILHGNGRARTGRPHVAKNPDDIIMLVNRTGNNYILDLPTGRYRLDANRRMRTMRSILKYPQIIELIHEGSLAVE
jgi:hypothetical protein